MISDAWCHRWIQLTGKNLLGDYRVLPFCLLCNGIHALYRFLWFQPLILMCFSLLIVRCICLCRFQHDDALDSDRVWRTTDKKILERSNNFQATHARKTPFRIETKKLTTSLASPLMEMHSYKAKPYYQGHLNNALLVFFKDQLILFRLYHRFSDKSLFIHCSNFEFDNKQAQKPAVKAHRPSGRVQRANNEEYASYNACMYLSSGHSSMPPVNQSTEQKTKGKNTGGNDRPYTISVDYTV